MKKLYLAVTNDKYELPLFVCDTLKELGLWANRKSNSIGDAIHYNRNDKKNKCKYYKVNIEEEIQF